MSERRAIVRAAGLVCLLAMTGACSEDDLADGRADVGEEDLGDGTTQEDGTSTDAATDAVDDPADLEDTSDGDDTPDGDDGSGFDARSDADAARDVVADGGPDGGCVSAADCDDADPCTVDVCLADGACTNDVAELGASCDESGGVCDADGECVVCVDDAEGDGTDAGCGPAAPMCGVSGCAECLQNTDCGGAMVCAGGVCVGCASDADCDDDVACTVDTCDLESGVCQRSTEDAVCDDGAFCNGVEQCAPTDGMAGIDGCIAGTPPGTADGYACTSDHCDEDADAMVHVPNDALCDDGDPCTASVCEAGAGCVTEPVPAGGTCDGGAGVCDGSGACADCTDSAAGDAVDRGCGGATPFCVDAVCVGCLGDEHCGPNQVCDAGVCVGCTQDADCDDGVACTVDACDLETTVCRFTPSDGACDDGLFCTGVESCQPQSMAADANGCIVTDVPNLEDDVLCTTDYCDEDADVVVHAPTDAACDDANECTLDVCVAGSGCTNRPFDATVTCEGETGFCDGTGACAPCVDDTVGGVDAGCSEAAPSCADEGCIACVEEGPACPLDCEGTPGGSAREDACGVCDSDPTNDCIEDCGGVPCVACDPADLSVCDDGNPCTAESCVDGLCAWDTAAADGTVCTDESVCTISNVCAGGACVADEVRDCSGPCFTGCDPIEGCLFADVGTACDDGLDATVDDQCNGLGRCAGICDDGNPCTLQVFGPLGDGTFGCGDPIPLAAGTACGDDSDACFEYACDAAGVCERTVAPGCTDCDVTACDGPCMTGVCTPGAGCELRLEGATCDDGNELTDVSMCTDEGRCIGPCRDVECGFGMTDIYGACTGYVMPYGETGCPESDDPCLRPACESGMCGFEPRTDGEACPHPCGAGVCDPTGVCQLAEDHCPARNNPCVTSTCDETVGACADYSEDERCLMPGAECLVEAGACTTGTCGDGWCDWNEDIGHAFPCPADCPPCDGDGNADCQYGYTSTEWAGAWRAFQSTAYGWPTAGATQTETFTQMLEDGVHWLHLIVDYCDPGELDGSLCLCAGDDECAGAFVPLEPRLEEIVAWMEANPTEIVTLLMTAYVQADDVHAVFDRTEASALLLERSGPPGTYQSWEMNLWEMIHTGQRLVVFGGPYLSRQNVLIGTRVDEEDRPDGSTTDVFNPGNRGDNEWECADSELRTPAEVPGFAGLYGVLHTSPGTPSWAASSCYNRYDATVDHELACGRYASVNVIFYEYYSSGSGPLLNATGSSPYEDRCNTEVEGCLTDDDCDSGVCGGLFICLTCETDDQCPDNQHCNSFLGSCVSDLPDGAPCLDDGACQSGNCDALCYSCQYNSDCESYEYCDAYGGCRPRRPIGGGCVRDEECIDGNCHWYFCAECNEQSDCGDDEFCNLNTLPGESECVHKTPNLDGCVNDFECQSGNCHAATCSECDEQSDCEGDTYCTLDLVPPIESTCEPLRPNGESCATDVECETGVCTLFECGECVVDAACEENEHCDAFNTCVPDVANDEPCVRDTQCETGFCSAGFCAECLTDAWCEDEYGSITHCDAFGDCQLDVVNDFPCTRDAQCITGLCSAGFCAECDNDTYCYANSGDTFHCDAFGDCVEDVGNNSPCVRDSQCTTGLCIAGFCAECENDVDCFELDGHGGTHCDAGGDCVDDVGNDEPCLRHSQCTTGICSAGLCAECVDDDALCESRYGSNYHCDGFGDCVSDVGNNAPCVRDAQCSTGLCLAGFCAECENDVDCFEFDGNSLSHCDAGGDCVADVGNNDPCLRHAQCDTGICSVGFCAQCLNDGDCDASDHCDVGGDCVDDVGNNAACTRHEVCSTGLCSAGFCAECDSNGDCEWYEFCGEGGDCTDRVGLGEPCGRGDACLSGCCSFFTCVADC